MQVKSTFLFKAALAVTLGLAVSGCFSRFSRIGEAPEMAPIEDPAQRPGSQVVSYPLPAPSAPQLEPNALWVDGKKSFFGDQRARNVGDLLTVVVNIDDEAALSNRTSRARSAQNELGLNGFFGVPGELDDALPGSFEPGAAVDLESASGATGQGSVDRQEEVKLRIAAIVVQELPNGNFVISGRQEVRVNAELREVRIAGIIRPEDIATGNTILYEQIAEARFTYGGRGVISDIQQPRYGQEVLDIILPF